VLVPPFSTGSHIGITCATGLSVTVATGSGDREGARADFGGKPSSQVAARTLEAGRWAWSCPAVVARGDRRTTSTTRLPVAPPLRGMLRSSRRSVEFDWQPPRRAKTWSISDMDLQEAFGCLAANQRSPCLRLLGAALLTPPCFRFPLNFEPARASFGLALPEAALLPPCGARLAGGRGGSFDIAVRCSFRT